MLPVHPGASSGMAAFPSKALANPAPSRSATWITSSPARMQPAPTSIATLSPALSTSAARLRSCSRGTTRGVEYPTLEWMVLCACSCCSTAFSSCRSLGRITQVTHFSAMAMRNARSIACLAAAGRGCGLPHDGDHGLMVHSGVVQSVEQVDCPRAGSGQTHAGLAGELGVRSCHERGQLLMARLDETRPLVASVFESGNHPVDPVAGIAEDALDAPRTQPFDQEVSHRLCHVRSPRANVAT